MNFTVSDFI